MIRIIGLFRKQGFKGNYLSFQHVVDEVATYFVVMGDENNGNQGLFKANLLTVFWSTSLSYEVLFLHSRIDSWFPVSCRLLSVRLLDLSSN